MIPHPLRVLPDIFIIASFKLANSDRILVGTFLVFKPPVVVEEDAALNHFLFSLRALVSVLFRPNSDSLDDFDFDAPDPPFTPPACRSVSPLLFSSAYLTFSPDDALALAAPCMAIRFD